MNSQNRLFKGCIRIKLYTLSIERQSINPNPSIKKDGFVVFNKLYYLKPNKWN